MGGLLGSIGRMLEERQKREVSQRIIVSHYLYDSFSRPEFTGEAFFQLRHTRKLPCLLHRRKDRCWKRS